MVMLHDQQAINLGAHAEILRDATQSLRLEDVSSPDFAEAFRPAEERIPNHGLTTDAFWYRVRVRAGHDDGSGMDGVLEIQYPPLDQIDLHVVRAGGTVTTILSGDRRPQSPQQISHRNYAFPLRIDANETVTLYLRVQSEGSHQLPLILHTSREFLRKTATENLWFGLYYGIMAVMALYNLFVFLSVRDVAYLYYILYLASVSTLYFMLNGFARVYLWGDWPVWLNFSSLLFVALPSFFVVLFTQSFLQIRKHSKTFYWLLNGLLLYSMICIALLPVVPYAVSLKAGTLLTMVQSVILVVVGFVMLTKGVRAARFFLLAWGVFLVGVLLKSLEVADLVKTGFLTTYGVQIGTCLDVTLLSLALADRINVERREKLKAQAEARHAHELEKWNQTLEDRVRAQVQQLEGLGRLKNYFPPQVAELILAEGNDALLQPKRREVTVCVIDMRGFTAFAEQAGPDTVVNVLRQYYAAMGAIVDRYQGTVESFAGDGMTIFFNAPLDTSRPEEAAVRMAFEMREAFEPLREQWARKGYRLGFGIGLANGPAAAGTIGFERRWQYAAIGIVTNIAARLCGLAAHGEILTTARLHAVVAGLVRAEPLKETPIRGLRQPVRIMRLLNLQESGAEAACDDATPASPQPRFSST